MMKYGERLKAARSSAGLSQAALADLVKISQANISKLEVGDATGSEFTVQFARACNVDAEWLATGEGEMQKHQYNVSNEMIAHLSVMQQLPEYARTEVIRDAIKTAELIAKATSAAKHNGTQ